MSSKRAIVLDIDENLIHCIIRARPNTQLKRQSDFNFQLNKDQYYVFKRPGLDNFLKTVYKEFDFIGFWTTGVKPYARKILTHILSLDQAKSAKCVFIYTRQDCAKDAYGYYKPLRKIWKNSKKFRPKNTIMMDNTLIVMRDNLENGLLTPSYDDKVLKKDKYLPWLELQIKRNLKKMPALQFVAKYSQPK